MFGWYGNNYGLGAWLAMALMMLLFWGGLVAIVILLVRSSRSSNGTSSLPSSHHNAERILNERFARGEIDEEEYVARSAALRRLG